MAKPRIGTRGTEVSRRAVSARKASIDYGKEREAQGRPLSEGTAAKGSNNSQGYWGKQAGTQSKNVQEVVDMARGAKKAVKGLAASMWDKLK